MSPLAILGAIIIGLSLGLTGAGGSILTLPVLIHLAGIAPREAVAMSLFIVGTAAAAGAVQRARAGHLHVRAAGWFALSGIAGAMLGSRFTHFVPESALVATFAAIMVIVGIRMWRAGPVNATAAPECRPLRCFAAGGLTGLLTGFLGVGGGFLLVPALTRFARLPMLTATGTSLAIIAVNAFAGFSTHIRQTSINWPLSLLFAIIAAIAILFGGRLASRLNPLILRRSFATLILLTAATMVIAMLTPPAT